jgi:hypothetical protein
MMARSGSCFDLRRPCLSVSSRLLLEAGVGQGRHRTAWGGGSRTRFGGILACIGSRKRLPSLGSRFRYVLRVSKARSWACSLCSSRDWRMDIGSSAAHTNCSFYCTVVRTTTTLGCLVWQQMRYHAAQRLNLRG